MRKLKGFIPTTLFIAVLAFGTTFAHAGILINGSSVASTSSTEAVSTTDTKTLSIGILINGVKDGILINGLLGILING
jgi:hypothetical protein